MRLPAGTLGADTVRGKQSLDAGHRSWDPDRADVHADSGRQRAVFPGSRYWTVSGTTATLGPIERSRPAVEDHQGGGWLTAKDAGGMCAIYGRTAGSRQRLAAGGAKVDRSRQRE